MVLSRNLSHLGERVDAGGRVSWLPVDGDFSRLCNDSPLRKNTSDNTYSIRRHQSPIIPIRCGPYAETFYVHRDILTKEEFFRNALNGQFREAEEQAIDLAEEDPALFSFVVAYLYEGKYSPIKPASKALGGFLPRNSMPTY